MGTNLYIPDDLVGGDVSCVVDSHDEHRRVGRWRGDDDLLGSTINMSFRLVDRREDAGRLYDVLGASRTPRNLGRVSPYFRTRQNQMIESITCK